MTGFRPCGMVGPIMAAHAATPDCFSDLFASAALGGTLPHRPPSSNV
ncbi:hypothetical protein predicted by Glimmer/Critica [Acetobacter senegalensis]|uniref:Uncharacterized protein n=1 Tax=Acetobacter senegalensis TaxID=446692 RepID=A0A0U5B9P0_9PROT|nr:hypothetical protein predicted by Glimmer/Critica [Acetobacter senegalensis]